MADGVIKIDIILDDGSVKKGIANIEGLGTASEKGGMSIGKMATAFGLVKVASAAMNVVRNSIDGAIKRVDVLNNSTRVFANMGFSAKETKTTMDNLKKSIQGLPTPLDEAVQGVQLIASSTNDLGKSEKIYAALNNGILGFGGSTADVNNAVLQLSQAFSNGKVDAQTWNSMLNSQLGPALGALAKKMGKTTGQLKEDLSSGKISVEEFQDALIDLNVNGGGGLKSLEKIAQDATAGIGTGMANMKTAVVRGLANIIQKFDEITKKLTGKTIGQNITAIGNLIDKVFEAIVKSMDNVIPIIEAVTSFVKDNATAFKVLGGVVGVALTAFIAFRSTVGIMTSVKNAITGVKTAFTLMKAAMIANPFALVIAGVAALAAVFVYFYKTSEGFREKVDGIIKTASKMINKFIQSETVTKVLAEAMDKIKNVGSKLGDVFKKIASAVSKSNKPVDLLGIAFKGLKLVAMAFLGPIGLVIKAFELIAKALGGGDINKGMDTMLKSFDGLAEGIKKNGPLLGSSFGKALEGILTAIGKAIPGIVKGALQIVAGFIKGIAQGLPQIALAAVQLVAAFTGAMLMLIPSVVASVTLLTVSFLNALTRSLPKIIEAGSNLIKALLQGITEELPSVIESTANLILTWLTSLTEQLPKVLQAGIDLLLTFLEGIASNIGLIVDQAVSIVVNFVSAIAARMDDIVNTAVDLIVNFVSGLASRMPDIVKAAVDLIANFINGIANNIGKVIDAGVNLVIKVVEGIGNRISDIINAGMNLVDKLVQGVLNAQDRLFKAAITLVNGMAQNIRNNSGLVRSAGRNLLSALIESLPGGALISNGLALANGLLSGLKQGFENVKSTVSGWATWIKNNKGPISYDKRLLIDNGKAIVSGLNRGLEDSFRAVKETVFSLTDMINDTVRQGIESTSLTDLLSEQFGEKIMLGWELGIKENLKNPKKALENAMSSISMPSLSAESATGLGRTFGMSTTNNYYNNSQSVQKSGTGSFVVEVPVNIDGREVARVTAPFTEKELDKRTRINKRLRGERN